MTPVEQIDRRIERALAKHRLAFRGVLTGLDTAPGVQLFQGEGLAGEPLRDNELFQHYGFTSAPPAGTMTVVLPIGGETAHGIVIATEHASYRLVGLADGEAALYDDQGQVVYLKRDGILVKTGKKLRLEAEDIEMHAAKSWSWDVDGYGERWTSLGGGTYEHKTWQRGAVIIPVTRDINPPEGP